MQGLNLNAPLTSKRPAARLGGRYGRLCKPDSIYWCDGSRKSTTACASNWSMQAPSEAQPRQAPWQLPGLVRPIGRGPRGRPHLHLLGQEGRRPTNNWMAPAEMRATLQPLFRRLHEGPHHVRGALQHGPAGQPHRPHRRGTDRQRLRGREPAPHDPHGQGRVRRAGRGRRVRALHAHRGRTAGRRREGHHQLALQPQVKYIVHHPETREIWSTARATAATRCWARSAWRCASPPPWAATRAGWPSTCSSWA